MTGNSGNISIGFTAEEYDEVKVALNKLAVAITVRKEEGGLFLHLNYHAGNALYFVKPKW